MRTTIRILLVIFVVFLMGFSCGCVLPPSDNDDLYAKITFNIPKTSFAVGEDIEGEYFVISNSKPFFILEIRGKEGYDGICSSQEIGISENISKSIRAFEITNDERACSEYSLSSFKTPGNYTFEVRVYEYRQIRELVEAGYVGDDIVNTRTNPDAKTNAKVNAIVTQIPPLATMKKVVTVTEVVVE